MKAAQRWLSWLGISLLLHAAGCATDRTAVGNSLMSQPTQRKEGVAEHYRAGCPDVLALEVRDRPEFTGQFPVGVDGRIDLGDYGKPRVEGRTTKEIIAVIGEEIGAAPENVKVEIAKFRSQHLLLFGEVVGSQRSLPYHGQETVLDLLQRVGGITKGAEPRDVYVVRAHLGENQRPEVIRVDLDAITLKNDHRTNIRLLPYDQIYVGETRRSQVERAIPPWVRSLYTPVDAKDSGRPSVGLPTAN
jgi:protein involved in polysaccharide export with SLBB domain